jgi:hypothetical protein
VSTKVADAFQNHKTMLFENRRHRRQLVIADFDPDNSPAMQMVQGSSRNGAIAIKPVHAAIEGDFRIVIANLRRKRCDDIAANIGRI